MTNSTWNVWDYKGRIIGIAVALLVWVTMVIWFTRQYLKTRRAIKKRYEEDMARIDADHARRMAEIQNIRAQYDKRKADIEQAKVALRTKPKDTEGV